MYIHVGDRSLKEFSTKSVINALYETGFADADWEQLGLQLNQKLANIRYIYSYVYFAGLQAQHF